MDRRLGWAHHFSHPFMEVIAVTLFISTLLALVFIVSFVSESRRQKGWRYAERDALLPLEEPEPALKSTNEEDPPEAIVSAPATAEDSPS